jgi:hypothetical protein
MIRFARLRPPAPGVRPLPHAPGARSCPACSGSNTRLIRKTLSHATGSASAVVVCRDCAHFWQEVAAPRLPGATA